MVRCGIKNLRILIQYNYHELTWGEIIRVRACVGQ